MNVERWDRPIALLENIEKHNISAVVYFKDYLYVNGIVFDEDDYMNKWVQRFKHFKHQSVIKSFTSTPGMFIRPDNKYFHIKKKSLTYTLKYMDT